MGVVGWCTPRALNSWHNHSWLCAFLDVPTFAPLPVIPSEVEGSWLDLMTGTVTGNSTPFLRSSCRLHSAARHSRLEFTPTLSGRPRCFYGMRFLHSGWACGTERSRPTFSYIRAANVGLRSRGTLPHRVYFAR